MTASGTRVQALLFDTNVLLDVLLPREPWAVEGALLLDAVARGRARGFVSSHAITTLHYVIERAVDGMAARTAVSGVLDLLDVVPLDTSDFQRALTFELADYEDAVQVAACVRAGADSLVSRDAKHFRGAPVRLRTPGEMLAVLVSRRRSP